MLAANVSHLSPAEGPPPEADVPKRCPATIPFSSLSRFSLLHIDVEIEEPGTSENPTRSFEIHNIGSHIFWRLYILYDIDIYVGYMIIF